MTHGDACYKQKTLVRLLFQAIFGYVLVSSDAQSAGTATYFPIQPAPAAARAAVKSKRSHIL